MKITAEFKEHNKMPRWKLSLVIGLLLGTVELLLVNFLDVNLERKADFDFLLTIITFFLINWLIFRGLVEVIKGSE
jgi:uncharacterized membrane protein HdeD (DUF308 family)